MDTASWGRGLRGRKVLAWVASAFPPIGFRAPDRRGVVLSDGVVAPPSLSLAQEGRQ
ncbi:MAG: hypothetical protein WB801_10955 [Candidatus Dormiibacterota bacterium]